MCQSRDTDTESWLMVAAAIAGRRKAVAHVPHACGLQTSAMARQFVARAGGHKGEGDRAAIAISATCSFEPAGTAVPDWRFMRF
jgi:hypothetical protein